MLDINITIEGEQAVITGINNLAADLPKGVDRGLVRIAQGVHREAYEWLSGAGGAAGKVRTDYTGFTKKTGEDVIFRSYQGAGGYPVPVRAGHLRRSLDWLKPGASKTGEAGTFTAGTNEVVIYDSSEHANVIHEGTGSSRKFGPRRYMKDALERFNQGSQISRILEEEIQREIEKGFK